MARPKAFEVEAALNAAKMVFWRQGYNATTTDDLRLAMGIGRQSFYDTFKSKHDVFVQVLNLYNSGRGIKLSEIVQSHASPLETLEAILTDIADEDADARALGCIGVASICEFGTADSQVAEANSRAGGVWRKTFEKLIDEGKAKHEVRSSLDTKAAANYLQTMMAGLRVSSRAGAKPKEMREIVKVAIDGLRG